jgi:hypothetical protein
MSLSAVESVGDAIDVTREFATPATAGRWLRLLALALLTSGGGLTLSANLPPVSPTFDPTYRGPTAEGVQAPPLELPVEQVPGRWLMLAGVLVAALVALGVTFAVAQALGEFAFVEALRTETPAIRDPVGRHWRRALGLAAFRIALVVGALASVGGLAALAQSSGLAADPLSAARTVAPVAALAVVGVTLVDRLTSLFVVPVAIRGDCGVLAGWRRTAAAMRAEPAEFVTAVVVIYVLGAVLAAVTVVALALVAALLAGVVALVAVVLSLAGVAPLSGAGLATLVVVGALAALMFLTAATALQVPVQTYLRYYALLVLGDVDDGLDLVGEQRERARERRLGVASGKTDLAER